MRPTPTSGLATRASWTWEPSKASGQQNAPGILCIEKANTIGPSWYIQAWIGTPGEPFYLLADSGAPNLSIESTLLPPEAQGDVPKYDPSKSSTAQQEPGYTYSECFGSGYCDNGVVYRDVFTVGQIAVTNMHIMVQTNNTEKSYGIRSGNLGLNIDRKGMVTEPNRLPTWFETIIPSLDGEFFFCFFSFVLFSLLRYNIA